MAEIWDTRVLVHDDTLIEVISEGPHLKGLGNSAGSLAGHYAKRNGKRAKRISVSTSATYGFTARFTAKYRLIER